MLNVQNASLSELLGVKTTFSELSQAKRECEEKKAGLVKELSACVSVSKLVGQSSGNAAPRENDQLIVFLEDTVEALRQEVTRCNSEATQHQQYAHGLQVCSLKWTECSLKWTECSPKWTECSPK
jgi:hypothetical protein